MSDEERKELVPYEPGASPEKPEAVREAEDAVKRWGLILGGTGAVGSLAYWIGLLQFGVFFPIQWWMTFLIALVALFFFPPNRGPRNARGLLRRWDELGIQQALEDGGASPDPKVRVAEEMARRVSAHPTADAEVRQAAVDLLGAIRRTAHDRRTIQLLQRTGTWESEEATEERTLSDVLDFISGREGELLASLERLHRAVVKRDASAAGNLGKEAQDFLSRLEAEEEVENLLNDGE
jgi:hypothetical protein